MTFLQKLGQWIVKGIAIANGAYPFVPEKYRDEVAKGVDTLSHVGGIVVQVEAVGEALQIKGPDKLRAAAGPAAQAILQSALVAGRKIANPELFRQGSTKIADGVADILNSLDQDEVKGV